MKVLLITLRSDTGGGPKHVKDLIGSHSFKSIDLFVASPLSDPYGNLFKLASKRFFQLPHRKFSLFKFISLLLFCRKNSIQIIHSHGRGAGLYSRLLALFGFPVVHTFHGVHREDTFFGLLKSFMDIVLSPLATKYICVSDDEKKEAINARFCMDANVVYNGTQISKDIRTDFSAMEPFKIGLLARLTYQKGIDILLNHARAAINLPCKFIIAGDGEDESTLKSQVSKYGLKNVELIGRTDKPVEFLKGLDIFLSTSRWEGFPLSVIEAMAIPLPCLLSDVPGHGYFKEFEIAKIYKLQDENDFIEKLTEMITDQQLREDLASKARRVIENELTIDKMGEKTIEVYQECI